MNDIFAGAPLVEVPAEFDPYAHSEAQDAPEYTPGVQPGPRWEDALPVRLIPAPEDRGDAARTIIFDANTGLIFPELVRRDLDGLGYWARTAIIDNPTGQWWLFDDQWVPPYTIGRRLRLVPKQTYRVLNNTPTSFASSPASGEMMIVRIYDREITPHPGYSVAALLASGALAPAERILDSNGNALLRATPGDTLAPPVSPLAVTAFPEVFNPDAPQWERMRGPSATQGAGAIAHTGLPYSLPVGFLAADTYRIIQAFVGSDGMAANGNYLGVMALAGLFNGTNLDRARTPNVFKTATATGAGNTTVWTAGAGKKFRLMGGFLMITANASLAAAGLEEIVLNDSGTAIGIGASFFLPNAALAGDNSVLVPLHNMGNGYLSSGAAQTLQINLGTALATGEARISVWGIEE